MYNFNSYNVLLAISTNIPAAYDCVCAPGMHIIFKNDIYIYINSSVPIEQFSPGKLIFG